MCKKTDEYEDFVDESLSEKRNLELNEYRKSGKFTDLTLQSTDNGKMKVHKTMISASCPYFRGMFNSNDNVETRQDVIQLQDDITLKDLEIIIEYLYTGKAKVFADNASNLFIKAQYFNLVELQKCCSQMLIRGLKLENCLELWRLSVKYGEDTLLSACLKFCSLNADAFFGKFLLQLTYDELKAVITREELPITQEHLFSIVIKWCKEDSDVRKEHVNELMEIVDFSQISNEFIESVVLVDEILQINPPFLVKMNKFMIAKLKETTKTSKETSQTLKSVEENNPGIFVNISRIKINLITTRAIYKMKPQLNKCEELFEKERPSGFSACSFQKNIFLSGGEGFDVNIFESYVSSTKEIIKLPSMLDERFHHRSIELNSKIYCCGGELNFGTTEIFDTEKLQWNYGPKMCTENFDFGITFIENSIYAVGGSQNYIPTSIVEHFDPRVGKWNIISDEDKKKLKLCLGASTYINNSIYSFNELGGGQTFDIRTNKWNRTIKSIKESPGFDHTFRNTWSYDIAKLEDVIYGVFSKSSEGIVMIAKYDFNEDCWSDSNISQKIGYSYLRLCTS